MKTNQIMIRESMVEQRTKDGYFNANKFLEFWNKNNPKDLKQMNNYKKNKSCIEFCKYLQDNEDIKSPIITGRGKNGGTWMHPKVFIDFAMWVSLQFKSKVIDWVLDNLIQSRHDAGDYYKGMCNAIMTRYIQYYKSKPSPMIYIKEANMIKELCKINKDRNKLTESELQKITTMQKVNSTLILEGVGITSRKNHLSIIARSI